MTKDSLKIVLILMHFSKDLTTNLLKSYRIVHTLFGEKFIKFLLSIDQTADS